MLFFRLATLTPLALLILGNLRGGVWIVLALLAVTAVTWALDRLVRRAAVAMPAEAEFPAGDGLLSVLALGLLAGLALGVRAAGGDSGFSAGERLGLLIGWGLALGQIGHPAAHELIHRPARGLRGLGRALYAAVLMGHHASSHLRVHHPHVGTIDDPASPPAGLGFWRYAPRAWIGSFRAGWRAETALRARSTRPLRWWSHPYTAHLAGAAAALALAIALAGAGGAAALLLIAAHTHLQILLSDYIQHYGLRRRLLPDGRPEPVGPQHSWNAPHFWSSAMMLNAPRHSDHHVNPSRPYPALRLEADMPVLPRPVPVMAMAALVPPLWRKMMDRRAAKWQRG